MLVAERITGQHLTTDGGDVVLTDPVGESPKAHRLYTAAQADGADALIERERNGIAITTRCGGLSGRLLGGGLRLNASLEKLLLDRKSVV